MKVALVHDYLGEFGGAERVLLALSDLFPKAPIYTAFYREDSPAWARFKGKDVRVSWAHHIPGFATKLHSPLRFLAPLIWNSFDFSSYDVVIGSSGWYVTKGFTRKGNAVEICYCHTPPRWLYGYPTSVEWQKYAPVRWYAALTGFFMRHYDYEAAQRVNFFIANSKNTAARIWKFYRRDAAVIYPPVDAPKSARVKRGNYFLIASRIVGGKGLALAVEAATKLKIRLKVVGEPAGYATEQQTLLSHAGPTVEFVGHVTDSELTRLYAGAKAFLATAMDEDFGMTPVEAMAAGTPVVAFRGGGYLESVVDGKTGVFFDEPTVESLATAITCLGKLRIAREDCIAQARKFSGKRFRAEVRAYISSHVSQKAPKRV